MNETAESHWAIIELMGHVRYGGRISKDNEFGTAMLRLDVPQEDGSFVSQLINPASLYRVTICEEAIARSAAKQGQSRAMDAWELKWELKPVLPAPKAEPIAPPDSDKPEEEEM